MKISLPISAVKVVSIPREDLRAILKALSWRAVAALDTMFVSWWVTGELALAMGIMGVEAVTKVFIYYAHEKAWLKFR